MNKTNKVLNLFIIGCVLGCIFEVYFIYNQSKQSTRRRELICQHERYCARGKATWIEEVEDCFCIEH
jgi:hypothetical protein